MPSDSDSVVNTDAPGATTIVRTLTVSQGMTLLHNLRHRIANLRANWRQNDGSRFLILTAMEIDAVDIAIDEWMNAIEAGVFEDDPSLVAGAAVTSQETDNAGDQG